MPKRRKTTTALLTGAVLTVAVLASLWAVNMSPAELVSPACTNLQELTADAWRSGQLHLHLDGAELAIDQTTPLGDRIYTRWGPTVPAIYAVVDGALGWTSGGRVPKMPLFALAFVIHLWALTLLMEHLRVRRRPAAVFAAVAYLFSFPVLALVQKQGFLVSNTAPIVFGSCFLTVALYHYAVSFSPSRPARHVWLAAGSLAAAMLSRETLFLTGFVLTVGILIGRRFDRRAIGFAAVSLGAVFVQLGYNALRFGSALNFGYNRFQYQHPWEEAALSSGMLQWDLGVRVARLADSIPQWFGGSSGSGVLYDGEDGGSMYLLLALNLLLIGLVYLAVKALRRPRAQPVEAILTAVAAAHLGYYVLIVQDSALRWLMEFWPVLFVLGVVGCARIAETLLGEHVRLRPLSLVAAVALWSLIAGARPEPLEGPPSQRPEDSQTWFAGEPPEGFDEDWCFAIDTEWATPPPEVACSHLEPRAPGVPPPAPWSDMVSLMRVGLDRAPDGSCRTLFFGGATLARAPGGACAAVLDFAEPDVDCAQVRLQLDGYDLGPMSSTGPDVTGSSASCSMTLPHSDFSQHRVYYAIGATDVPTLAGVRESAPDFAFERLSIRCN